MNLNPDQPLSPLAGVMQADRHRLRGLARRIEQGRRDGRPVDRLVEQFSQLLSQSTAQRERRWLARPAITYDTELPITAKKDEIAQAIQAHPVVVVCGETGSGKSTQLPKICLELGRGITGMIGHTQPRRIAARSVAARLAEELGSSVGNAVGFKIRFTDSTSGNTFVKLMTDGILLAETQGDRFLDQYDTIIVDEAHERSLNIDFLLGYLRRLLPKRPDLRVIITSATIDAERFSEHFVSELGPAPVIHVSGRTYPVETWYRPPQTDDEDDEPNRQQAVLDAIDELLAHDSFGDILVFLATEREILEVTKALRGRVLQAGRSCEVLPLYARLSTKEQNRVFEKHTARRIVLATNVAESSLTVPGIRYVVDEGTARISRYAARSKIQRLPIEPVSQASANQRQGRCGRLGPGICVRLYSEEDFLARDRFTPPEIRRSNLAAVILQAESLKLGALSEFPFLDPPQPHLIRDGYATLFELGAVDGQDVVAADGETKSEPQSSLTPLGQRLSRLPVDPRIGRMILASIDEGCLREMLIIASALEAQDPRERPVDKQQAADEAHARFADKDSDFLTYLNLWNFYHELKEKLSRNQLKRACHQNFLSHTRLREWFDVHRQLSQLVVEHLPRGSAASVPQGAGLDSSSASASTDAATRQQRDLFYGKLHRALLTGLLSNIALKTDTAEYTGAGNLKFNLWPGSAAFAQKPKWIVAAELVETNRRYARCVASIQPQWIEPLARHLVQRSYSDPHWNGKSGAVSAYEKTTLFGLTIASRRPVPYGPIDPEHSRELFIREGLVKGDLQATAPFLEHNRKLRTEIEQLTAKSRRTDLVVDEFAIYGFYHKRLPLDVFDWARLNRWRRDAEKQNPDVLKMTLADMTAAEEPPPKPEDFPDQLQVERLRLPVEYHFEPGADRDGVTIVVPKAGLGQVAPERLGWLVPGLLEQKIVAMIRSLPKNLRRNLVPVPDTAKKVLSQLRFGEGRMLDAVAKLLTELAGEPIPVEAISDDKLPPHLRMNLRVVDDHGKTLQSGRDIQQLRESLGIQGVAAQQTLSSSEWNRDGFTRWEFGTLPEVVDVKRSGVTLAGFPAIVDGGDTVAVRLFDSREQAVNVSRAGVRRLFLLSEQRALKSHIAWFPEINQLSMYATSVYSAADFTADLMGLLADLAFIGERPLPRSADEFQQRLKQGRDEVLGAVQDATKVVVPLLKNFHAARLAIESASSLHREAVADVRQQLAELMVKNFLTETPWSWLQHLPRYLAAISSRLQKLTQGGQQKDRQGQTQLAPLLQAFRQRRAENERRGVFDPELATYRWHLEEFRVSLFAQQLGTSFPVSAKRLEKQWEKVVQPTKK